LIILNIEILLRNYVWVVIFSVGSAIKTKIGSLVIFAFSTPRLRSVSAILTLGLLN